MTPPYGTSTVHSTPTAHGEAFTGSAALAPDAEDIASAPSPAYPATEHPESPRHGVGTAPIPLFHPAGSAPRETGRGQGGVRAGGFTRPGGMGRHGARESGPDGARALEPSADDGMDGRVEGRSEGRASRSANGASAATLGYEHVREPLRTEVRGALGPFIDSLREVFERDRGLASQSTSTRCGICYLHFAMTDLRYREDEGFYVCPGCAQTLGSSPLFMVRRQRR